MFTTNSSLPSRANEHRYYRYCKVCKVHIGNKRPQAVTCSPRCRQAYKRMCDQITFQMRAAADKL